MFCPKCGNANPDDARSCSECDALLRAEATPIDDTAPIEEESSTGLSVNEAGFLCYLGGWMTGIVFVMLEKKSDSVRFHAWQSIVIFGPLTLLHLVLSRFVTDIGLWSLSLGLIRAGVALGWILGLGAVALAILLMIQTYQGSTLKLPLVGDLAEKQANKWRFQGPGLP